MKVFSHFLDNLTWNLCKTIEEGPGPRDKVNSVVIGDNLYVYGGEGEAGDEERTKDIFVLNFSKKLSYKTHLKNK